MRGDTAGPARRLMAALRGRRQGADVAGLDQPANGSPFQRGGRLTRVLPFAAVAAVAEASLALPPGPQSATGLAVSLILLAAVAGAIFLPWQRLPRWSLVLVPLAYLGSVLGLTIASGGTQSGVELVLLVPVVWTALFHRPWESVCVVAAFAAAAYLVSFSPGGIPAPIVARRELFLVAVAIMISVATHLLRGQVSRSQAATARLQGRLRELSIVADRDRIASSLHDTVVQRLFAVALSLQGCRSRTAEPEVIGRIDAAVADLDDAVKLVRQTIFGLGHGLPAHGLRRSILDVSSELTPVLGCVPEVVLDGPLDAALSPEAAAGLLEALRHALTDLAGGPPGGVVVSVVAAPGEVCLTVTSGGQQAVWRAPARPGVPLPGGQPGGPVPDTVWQAGPGAA